MIGSRGSGEMNRTRSVAIDPTETAQGRNFNPSDGAAYAPDIAEVINEPATTAAMTGRANLHPIALGINTPSFVPEFVTSIHLYLSPAECMRLGKSILVGAVQIDGATSPIRRQILLARVRA